MQSKKFSMHPLTPEEKRSDPRKLIYTWQPMWLEYIEYLPFSRSDFFEYIDDDAADLNYTHLCET